MQWLGLNLYVYEIQLWLNVNPQKMFAKMYTLQTKSAGMLTADSFVYLLIYLNISCICKHKH